MHSHVGITRPIFDTVSLINQIILSAHRPEEALVEALEMKLLQHNPELLTFHYPNKQDEAVFRAHASMFFSAALIYFRRYIRGESIIAVQNEVDIAVEQIRRVEVLSSGTHHGGWLWPVFVTACEMVQDGGARVVALAWFHRQEQLGLKNVIHAKELVKSIWSRHDTAGSVAADVAWFDVMRETNQDLLLL
jgi:hypothetical protein